MPNPSGSTSSGPRRADALLGGWPGAADPSLLIGIRMLPTGFSNPGGHSTDELVRLYEVSITTTDPDDRQEVLHEAVREVVEQVLEFTMFFPHYIYVTTEEVAGFEGYVSGNPQFRGAGIRSR